MGCYLIPRENPAVEMLISGLPLKIPNFHNLLSPYRAQLFNASAVILCLEVGGYLIPRENSDVDMLISGLQSKIFEYKVFDNLVKIVYGALLILFAWKRHLEVLDM